MLKKALIFFIIPTLLFSADIIKTFTFTRPEIRDRVVYMEGCRTSVVPFAPCLATKPVTLRLPYGENAVSFDVEYDKPIVLEGVHVITPFRPAGRISVPPPREYYTRASSVYNVDEFYPSQVKSPRYFTHFRYGHPIFIASVRPVQYNPITGEVRYFSEITVKIKTEKKRGSLPTIKFDPFIRSQLQVEIDNPESLKGLQYTRSQTDDYEYALITTDALKDSWGDFVDFNEERCLRTKIETIENINETGSGNTSADKLKNYLKTEYQDHSIVYVMLGGDDNISTSNVIQSDAITHKGYTAEFNDYGVDYFVDSDIAADMFYETLDGQELEDLEWELYAARFPADNATELQKMITKTIKYSTEPVQSAVNKAVVSGEYKWVNINGGHCWGKDQMQYLLVGTTDKNGYTTTGFSSPPWDITELFEVDYEWSKNDMLDAINGGLNFLFHTGHSNNFMIMKLATGDNDIAKLTNTAYNIGFTTGCYPGAWDNRKSSRNATFNTGHYADDCIAEEFTCGTDNGSVAFISNTRYGLGDDGHASTDGSDGSTVRYMRYFLDAIFGQKMHHIAVMIAYSKWINKQEILNTGIGTKPYYGQMAYCAYEINVLGDPALSIWTATPEDLTDPDYPTPLTGPTFQWNSGLPYAWIALVDAARGDIVYAQQSDVDGKFEINSQNNQALAEFLTANPDADFKIRIKAHNYLHFEGDLPFDPTAISDKNVSSFVNGNNFFGKTAKVTYILPAQGWVNIAIYNSKGAIIKTLVNEKKNTGRHSIRFNTDKLSNGIYYCRLKTDNNQCVSKFFVTK